MVDFEGEESVFLSFSAVWQEKKFMVKIFDIGIILVKSGEREVLPQIGSLPIKLGWLECQRLKLFCHTYSYISGQHKL